LRIVPAGTVVIQAQGGIEFASRELEPVAGRGIRLTQHVAETIVGDFV